MPKTALILTVFDRIEIFESTLKCLSRQTTREYDLYVCNNNAKVESFLLEKLAEWATRLKVDFTVHTFNNKFSIWGRHVLARQIASQYDVIVVLDDDEMFDPRFMEIAIRSVEPNVLKSFWAWECQEDYWVRKRLRKTKTGNYAGAGGLVAMAEFWLLPEMFEPPEEFWIIDDLWLSYVGLKNCYKVKCLDVSINFVRQKNATYLKIKPLKSLFYREYIYPLYW
jgi:glycosyltransferase involved in cell wall biosynthesis